ncbi:MAG: hypothetical protein ABJM58_04115 [Alteripontixanthobacter sp.]
MTSLRTKIPAAFAAVAIAFISFTAVIDVPPAAASMIVAAPLIA